MEPDYYAVLGLARDSNRDAIRRSFHAAALKHHPDVALTGFSHERFIQIEQAYQILSDPRLRRQHDRSQTLQAARGGSWWFGGIYACRQGGSTWTKSSAPGSGPFSDAFATAPYDTRAAALYAGRGGAAGGAEARETARESSNSFFSRVFDTLSRRL